MTRRDSRLRENGSGTRRRPEERYVVERAGLRLVVRRWAGSGAPVIALHGFLHHGGVWRWLAARLPHLDLHAPDARGHGLSGWVGAGGYYHFWDYLADLERIVAVVGEPPVLVGHSMGGTVASLWAGLRPDRLRALVLLEGIGPPGMGWTDALVRGRRWLDQLGGVGPGPGYATVEAALDRWCRAHPRVPRARARVLVEEALRHDPDGRWRWRYDPLHRMTSPQPFYLEQAAAIWSEIQVPTVLLLGEASPYRWNVERFRGAVPHAQVRELPGIGHDMHLEDPGAVAEVLAETISGLES